MYGIRQRHAIPRVLAYILAVACAAAPAAADDPDDEPTTEPSPSDLLRERSVTLYRQSVDEYRAGRFARAVDLLRAAYRTYPDANLLYNLARAHEGTGELEDAIAAYEAFLSASAQADDRAAIERRIETLRYQIVERDELVEDHRKAVEALDRIEHAHPRDDADIGLMPWLLGGAGLAAVATGTTLTALTLNEDDRTLELTALVTLAAGTALLTAAATWLACQLGDGE